jgi:hypothetical protein
MIVVLVLFVALSYFYRVNNPAKFRSQISRTPSLKLIYTHGTTMPDQQMQLTLVLRPKQAQNTEESSNSTSNQRITLQTFPLGILVKLGEHLSHPHTAALELHSRKMWHKLNGQLSRNLANPSAEELRKCSFEELWVF